MRLKNKEIEIIKSTITNIFEDVTVYLFGSRLDDNKRGGDIDLFVIAKNATLSHKIKALSKLQRQLHKPVDIVLHRDFSRDIEQEALHGIKIY